MKHAGEATLAVLEDLLKEIRKFGDLTEKKRGIFYRKATAFLHFHEDKSGLFADVKVGSKYKRYSVSSRAEQREVLKAIQVQLKNP